ncbi:MAG TPA: energy transducer TonB [Polyangia bacterium]|jgi:TonB family protein
MNRVDLMAVGMAVAIHAAVGVALLSIPARAPAPALEVDIVAATEVAPAPAAPAPPPAAATIATPAAAPGPRAANRRPATPAAPRAAVARRAAPASAAPAPPAPSAPVVATPTPPAVAAPAERPTSAEPPRATYQVVMDSPSVAGQPGGVPGGTGQGGRGGYGSGGGGTGHGAFGLPGGQGARDLTVKRLPEVDTAACGRTTNYPHEAERLGVEGEVRLRVALDERGRVQRVTVVSGLGHGLDQVAAEALKHRCRFTPALAGDGTPVAYTISAYVFRFELPR